MWVYTTYVGVCMHGVCYVYFTTYARNQAKSARKRMVGLYYIMGAYYVFYGTCIAVSADEVGCCCLNTLVCKASTHLGPDSKQFHDDWACDSSLLRARQLQIRASMGLAICEIKTPVKFRYFFGANPRNIYCPHKNVNVYGTAHGPFPGTVSQLLASTYG